MWGAVIKTTRGSGFQNAHARINITAQDTDIGATLNKALEAVEDENDAITARVLTSVDFNDKDRLSDAMLEELTYSKHDLHSDTFWNTVGSLIPDYRDQRKWLRINGNQLAV